MGIASPGRSLRLAVTALLLASAWDVSAAVSTFFDGTFNAGDWVSGPVISSINAVAANLTNQQNLTGGDPGAFSKFSTAVSGVGLSSVYRVSYFNNAAIYDPSSSGAILKMSGGFNNNLFSSTSVFDVFDASIVLRQKGAVYLPENFFGLQDVAPHWYGGNTLFGTSVPVGSASDWHLMVGSGPTIPDFSEKGSPIQFGLLVGAYFDSGSGTVVGGVDNWTITVTSAGVKPTSVPLPGTLSSLAALATTLCIGFRSQKRGQPLVLSA
jgi:hypothetical protein